MNRPIPPRRSKSRSRHTQQHQHQHRTSREIRDDSLRSGHHPLLSLNLNLDALAEAAASSSQEGGGGAGGGELAQELYQRISALYQEGYYAVPPDVVSFNSVLKAWRDDPERALLFWEQELVPKVEDDEHDYNVEMELGKRDASGRDGIHRRGRRRTPLLEPNVRSYNTFLWALARAGMFRQAEMLMDSMRHEQSLVLPDRITYNTVLLAYYNARCDALSSTKSSGPTHSNVRDELDLLPERSLQLLEEMRASTYTKPDAVTFNTILSIWATVGTQKAALKAQELLRLMSASCGLRPDVYTYTAVIQAWASVRDDAINTASASERALAILEEMKGADIQPSAVTYTIVMQALCRSNQPQAATALLNDVVGRAMRCSPTNGGAADEGEGEVRPDAVMFSALMDGWARWVKGSSHAATPEQRKAAASEAVRAVLDLLSQMKSLSATWPDVAPNERTYTSVLTTLARSRHYSSGLRAERVLEGMAHAGVVPTAVHWNAVLDAYAKSPRPDKVREARRVWSKMVRADVEPDVITYHTLLAAAASTRSSVDDALRRDCVKTGLQAFALMQRDPNVCATSLSFHYLFKILGRFLPAGAGAGAGAAGALQSASLLTEEEAAGPRRAQVVEVAFRLCCDAGCLNDSLLCQLREHVLLPPGEEERLLLGGGLLVPGGWRPNLSVADLPPSWSRHA